ncbi:MAG TPA: DUF2249 domain-containing protein [Trichormus sp.]
MNGETKLSEALKYGSEILDYVISLNPHDFERLRNPLMRKVMPVRITLKRIATMVGVPEQEFVDKINALAGLPRETVSSTQSPPPASATQMPPWMETVDENKIQWVDVLAGDEKLLDPMPPINIGVNSIKPGEVLGVKHKWEPQPLFDIWQARGFEFWSKQIGPDEWHIFVHKPIAD